MNKNPQTDKSIDVLNVLESHSRYNVNDPDITREALKELFEYKSNDIDSELMDFINSYDIEKTTPYITVQNILKEFTSKINNNMTKETQQTNEKEEIKKFFENYTIDPNTKLSHKDIYAYLNKVSKGEKQLEELLKETLGKDVTVKQPLKKGVVLKDIVYPIIEGGKIQEFKEGLNNIILKEKALAFLKDINNYGLDENGKIEVKEEIKKINNNDENSIKRILDSKAYKDYLIEKDVEQDVEQDVKTYLSSKNSIKKDFKEVRDFYLGYEFNPEKKVSHQDVFAFKTQFGKGGKDALEVIASYILDDNIELSKQPSKNEILDKIVYPIRKQDEFSKDFFEHVLASLEMKENLDLSKVNEMKPKEYIELVNGLNYPDIAEEFELAHLHKFLLEDKFEKSFEILEDKHNIGFSSDVFSDIKKDLENGNVKTDYKPIMTSFLALKEFNKPEIKEAVKNSISKNVAQKI